MVMRFFITGTDTGIGKTRVTCGLLEAAAHLGLRAVGMKPISSGCNVLPSGTLESEDVVAHQAAGNVYAALDDIGTYRFLPPISPHLAAHQVGTEIDFERIRTSLHALTNAADVVLVEGAGGWYAPLDATRSIADLALALDLPVILVVGLRLGCLNQAMLSSEAILAKGANLAGWFANHIDPTMLFSDQNIDYLHSHIPAPLLGVVPYNQKGNVRDDGSLSDVACCFVQAFKTLQSQC